MRIMEMLNALMDMLGMDQEQEVTWFSYLTFILAIGMTFVGGSSAILVSIICTVAIFLIGLLVVLIVRRLITNFLLTVVISSGVFLAVIVFLTSCMGFSSLFGLIDMGNVTFSWWGLFIFFPYIFKALKYLVVSVINFFVNGFRYMDHSGDFYTKIEKYVGWLVFLFFAIFFVVAVFIGIGALVLKYMMCSLCLMRGVAEFIRVMNKWVPEKISK